MGFKLVLGTIIGKPYPWTYGISIRAVMVNAYEILSKGILERARGGGLRRILMIDDDIELWLDSGGYQFLKRGINVSVDMIAKVYRSIDADFYVSLDYPPSPSDDAKMRASKIARSIQNYRLLKSLLSDKTILPVYHFSTGELLRIQLSSYHDADYVCIGGLVPYFMQLAGKYSRLKAVVFLALIRKLVSSKIHALGLASPAVLPILRRIEVDSADTMTWRQKAAYGKIIIPGMGERHVSGRRVRFGPKYTTSSDWGKIRHYLSVIKDIGLNIELEDLVSDFTFRAIFNAWSLQYIAEQAYDGEEIVSPAFRKLYDKASRLRDMEVLELENYFSSLVS